MDEWFQENFGTDFICLLSAYQQCYFNFEIDNINDFI